MLCFKRLFQIVLCIFCLSLCSLKTVMEQDGRQPVWPPHYIVDSGNNVATYPAAEQEDPMQHNGVSSSEGVSEVG